MKIIKTDRTIEKITFFIAFDKDEWNEIKNHAFNQLIKNVAIVGFRKGHVPLDIAKKHVSQQDVVREAVDKACKKAHKELVVSEIIEKNKDIFVDSLSYNVDKVESDQLILTCEFNLFPEVTLPNYKKMDIEFKKNKVTKNEVDQYIDQLIKKDILLEPKNGDIIAKGDTVVFDFKGFIDDKLFDGGEAKLFELEVGSNQFIPGFEDQMIGLKRGEQKSIKVTFPNNYHDKKFAGKDAKFELDIRDIKVTKKPELNDEYVKSLNIDNVKNQIELERHITKVVEGEQQFANRQTNMKLIYDFLKKHSKISYFPEFLLNKEKQSVKNTLSNEAITNNLTFEQFMEKNFHAKSEKQIEESINKIIKENITLVLSLSKIINELGITLSDKDREDYYKNISSIYNISINDAKKALGDEDKINEFILQNKIVDEIVKLNN